jgi:rhomboid protease GluP
MSSPDSPDATASAEPAPAAAASAGPSPDGAAIYLAKCMIADHGFVGGCPPEAAALADACDIVLTGGDGLGLTIACIIDREADPARRFSMPPAQVDELAAACRKHAGSMYGVKEAVTIEVWEVGPDVADTDDRARLEGYAFRQVTQKGVSIRGYALDPRTGSGHPPDLFTTAADGDARRAWVREIMGGRWRSDRELHATVRKQEKVARFDTTPLATYALLAAFAIMFVVELAWAVAPGSGVSPSIGTLIGLGGLSHQAVEDGEWWRMLTCAFLHGDPMHLLFNGVAMYMAGGVLENLVGRRWMLALFVIGALGGSAASMAVNDANIVSVGASGAIMGLLAAAMVASLRLPRGPRMQILVSLGQILIPSLLPLATHAGGKIDYGAHLGGAIAGAIAGGILLLTWSRQAERPRARLLAAVIAAVGLAATGYGLIQVVVDHDDMVRAFAADPALLEQIVPNDELPRSEADIAAQLDDDLQRYPRDPRVNYWAAQRALRADDVATGRAHLEKALAEKELRGLLSGAADFELEIRRLLALVYEYQGEDALAREVVVPSCKAGLHSAIPDQRTTFERFCAPE